MSNEPETVELVFQSYPLRAEYRPGQPTLVMEGFPVLPGEDFIQYGRRVAGHLGVVPAR